LAPFFWQGSYDTSPLTTTDVADRSGVWPHGLSPDPDLRYRCPVERPSRSRAPDPSTLPNYRAEHVSEAIFGGQLFVMEAGPLDKEPVVLLHGTGEGAADDWTELLASLAQRHRVVAIDLPGFGRSTRGNEHYSPDNYARLLDWLADQRVGRQFNLIGHSLGAAIALAYAGGHNFDLRRLVLINAAGILHRHAYGEHLARLGLSNQAFMGRSDLPVVEAIADGAISWLANTVARPILSYEPDPSLLLRFAKTRQKLLQGDPTRIASLLLVLKNFSESIDAVQQPPLIIWGADDDVAPSRTGKLLASRIPSSRLEILDQCGHVPMVDQPDRVHELIDQWLAEPPRLRALQPQLSMPSGPVKTLTQAHGVRLVGGEYQRIELLGCCQASLSAVRAGAIQIRESVVELDNCHIGDSPVGIEVTNSKLRMTGGSVLAGTGVITGRSDLDLAGVRIEGRHATLRAEDPCSVLFSVCPYESPLGRGHLHGIRKVGPDQPI
jgi:pimeloyl-ACP methyl ester carboxylesterase